MQRLRPILLCLALPLGLFFIIFGAKLVVIEKFGSDLPYWDQWDGEAGVVFMPYFDGRLSPANIFAPHNEHRIVFTKLLSLLLMIGDGQWDARLECVINAALHAAILSIMLAWIQRYWGLVVAGAGLLILIAVTAPPLAWENTLGGFQSQFYFLTGFSLAAMWLFLSAPAWSWRWCLAILCAFAAIFSMGSGFFCVLPVAGLMGGQLFFDRTNLPARLSMLLVCGVIVVTGWILHADVPGHTQLHAHRLHDFWTAFLHAAAWPRVEHTGPALLLYSPLALFFLFSLQKKYRNQPACQFILAGGAWVLLQIAATAYARGAGGALPANRYGDILALGVFFNGLALALLFRQSLRKYLVIGIPLAIAWSLTLANGIRFHIKDELLHGLPEKRDWSRASEKNVRAYLLTGHFERFEFRTLPYPDANALGAMLNQPAIRRILPASVTPALAIGSSGTASGFPIGAVPSVVPLLPYREIRGSFAVGEGLAAQSDWRSQPLPAGHGGFWRFEVAGNLGSPNLSLQLVSSSTGVALADVKPFTPADNGWRDACVRTPPEPSILVARDHSPTGWFAFSGPVEMSAGSYWCWRLTKDGWNFVILGSFVCLGGLIGSGIVGRQRPAEKNAGSSTS